MHLKVSTSEEIKSEYQSLVGLPSDSDGAAKRARGYAFERLLNSLFINESLEPRTSYRIDGEQIDGSLYMEGRVYLLEAKWHTEPLPASTLYQFKGKVDGKLVGTIGIFVSMSGYSKDAVDALTLGKNINVILFDRSDIDSVFLRGKSFRDILRLKLRKATEEGVPNFSAASEFLTAQESRVADIERLHFDHSSGRLMEMQTAQPSTADLLIICEGESDRIAISTLAKRILTTSGSNQTIQIVAAKGKVTIPRVANALQDIPQRGSRVLIVTDGDNDPAGTRAMLKRGIKFSDWHAAIPNPSIESWLDLEPDRIRRSISQRAQTFQRAAEALDIDSLKQRDGEFATFFNVILGP